MTLHRYQVLGADTKHQCRELLLIGTALQSSISCMVQYFKGKNFTNYCWSTKYFESDILGEEHCVPNVILLKKLIVSSVNQALKVSRTIACMVIHYSNTLAVNDFYRSGRKEAQGKTKSCLRVFSRPL